MEDLNNVRRRNEEEYPVSRSELEIQISERPLDRRTVDKLRACGLKDPDLCEISGLYHKPQIQYND